MLRATIAALAAFALAPVAGSAAPSLPDFGSRTVTGSLGTGGRYIVRTYSGAPVTAIALWYRAPSTGFASKARPSVARLAAQTVAASKPLIGDALGSQVRAAGGRLGISVYGDTVSVDVVVPSPAARRIARALTSAYFAPVVTDGGFQQARKDVAQEALLESFNAEAVVRDALFGVLFEKGPHHYPALGDPKEIAGIPLADVRSFAERAFRSQNAVIVVSGAADGTIATAFAAGRPASDTFAEPEKPSAETLSSAYQPAVQPFDVAGGGYGWLGPGIALEREATAMDFIADYLFHGDTGTVSQAIAAIDPTAVVFGQFVTLNDPGVLFVAYSGKDAAPLQAKVDGGLAAIKEPLASSAFAAAVDAFQYHLLSDVQTPSQLADVFGWYTVEGNPRYAPVPGYDSGTYFAAARSLTPEFVAEVARKYLGKPPATVSLKPAPKQQPKASPPS
ncbi:MAG: insulinase family protein [Candidatus Eremiobacteraeota bacterium]|nr:insulinase family protein [Candidatus Eremiobacteraeota bacterium]